MSTPSRDRGAAAVEFALVLPILLLLVIGIIEFGRAYNFQTTLSNAARDGVRVMALQNSASGAKSAAKASSSIPLTDSQITVSVTPSATTCTPGGAGTPGTASVTIRYPFRLISGFLPVDDFILTGKGTMRCLG